MSVITPLLDTLLHQVLGRRADIERISTLKPDMPLSAIVKAAPVRDLIADANSRQSDMPLSAGQGAAHASEKLAKSAAYYNQPSSASAQSSPQVSNSTSLHLSSEARTIASVLGRFPDSPAAVRVETQLVAADHVPVVPLLAAALRQQLSQSGIFYESHLMQWFMGRRSLEQLEEEPQARLSFTSNASANLPGAEQPARGQTALLNSTPPERSIENSGGDDRPASRLVHEASLPLLRQQLESIASQTFRWEGVAWPGVPLQWSVSDEGLPKKEDETSLPADERQWSTTLQLSLPSFGELEIRMTLQGKKVQLQAWSQDDMRVERLTSTAVLLKERLELSGLETASFHFMTKAPKANE